MQGSSGTPPRSPAQEIVFDGTGPGEGESASLPATPPYHPYPHHHHHDAPGYRLCGYPISSPQPMHPMMYTPPPMSPYEVQRAVRDCEWRYEWRLRVSGLVAQEADERRDVAGKEQAAVTELIRLVVHAERVLLGEERSRARVVLEEAMEYAGLSIGHGGRSGAPPSVSLYRIRRSDVLAARAGALDELRMLTHSRQQLLAPQPLATLLSNETDERIAITNTASAELLFLHAAHTADHTKHLVGTIVDLRNEIEPSKKMRAQARKAAVDVINFKQQIDEANRSASAARADSTKKTEQVTVLEADKTMLQKELAETLKRVSCLEVDLAKAKENDRLLSYNRAELQELRRERRQAEVTERCAEKLKAENRKLKEAQDGAAEEVRRATIAAEVACRRLEQGMAETARTKDENELLKTEVEQATRRRREAEAQVASLYEETLSQREALSNLQTRSVIEGEQETRNVIFAAHESGFKNLQVQHKLQMAFLNPADEAAT